MSDWKERARERRLVRQGGTDPRPTASSSKNTKRWCRGKVGVEHALVCKDYDEIKGSVYPHEGWKLLVCTTCGREIDFYIPSVGNWVPRKPVPRWVEARR